MLTPTQLLILRFLRRYFYARTAQIRDSLLPRDTDGSVTRENLRKLQARGFVRRHEPRLLEYGKTTAPPVFLLTQGGSCALAEQSQDVSHILTIEPTFKDWMSLNHYCALTSLHVTIDAAFAAQSFIKQHALFFEHEVIRPKAEKPSEKFRLNTVVSEKPLICCCPDSAFEIEINGKKRAYYIEREMGSDTPGRVAAKKHKGYAHLLSSGKFRNHFPAATDFRTLVICPNAAWRDLLRNEFKEEAKEGQPAKLKPGAQLWLFASIGDISAETFLHTPIFYTVEKGPLPFALPPPPAAGLSAGASAGGGK